MPLNEQEMQQQITELEKLKEKINSSNADLLEVQRRLMNIQSVNDVVRDIDVVGQGEEEQNLMFRNRVNGNI